MANLIYLVRKGKNKLSSVYLRFYTTNKNWMLPQIQITRFYLKIEAGQNKK